ncbi:ATP-grasp domain-containing protein [Amycolatopsis pigmentata]|uniref:Acetyl-CoA carboxylase biotin carboxylase subunit family protein n=1 Tax=Amycolatopsis pigmentata TaxID=450801 RepID=A0ABW5G2N9_9PSEU
MCLYLTALTPTDAVTHGLIPAAARLGLPLVVLTDRPEEHRAAYAGSEHPPQAIEPVEVREPGAIAARTLALASRHGKPAALFSNSDHLQTPTALAAELLGLPGKDWRATLRGKNKFLTRAALADAGLDTVLSLDLSPADDLPAAAEALPFPVVLKPREGVASEDVVLVRDPGELATEAARIWAARGPCALVAEEYLTGELRTYETLGDGRRLHHFGSWRTTLGPGPFFTESARDWAPRLPEPVERHLRAQLDALGVGLGACHTEFVIDGDRARVIEVNYRLIGDTMDLICAELLDFDLFAELIRLHLGLPLAAALPSPSTMDTYARVRYVTAGQAGSLVDAPADTAAELPGGLRLRHRRLRQIGVTAPLHGTNRDYLSVVHAIGPTSTAVTEAVDDFVATHRWVVTA